MSDSSRYAVPASDLALCGPVDRPAPGTLPLRGDLAHIALAGQYLAAHYAIPEIRRIASGGATLALAPRDDAEVIATLTAGSNFELLDIGGDWCWGCVGPEGPSGYVRTSALTA